MCRNRNAIRPPERQFFLNGYDELRASMRQHFGSLGWWFDTSDLTAAQTAQQILNEALVRAAVEN